MATYFSWQIFYCISAHLCGWRWRIQDGGDPRFEKIGWRPSISHQMEGFWHGGTFMGAIKQYPCWQVDQSLSFYPCGKTQPVGIRKALLNEGPCYRTFRSTRTSETSETPFLTMPARISITSVRTSRSFTCKMPASASNTACRIPARTSNIIERILAVSSDPEEFLCISPGKGWCCIWFPVTMFGAIQKTWYLWFLVSFLTWIDLTTLLPVTCPWPLLEPDCLDSVL